MPTPTAPEIRQQFLDFFAERAAHEIVPSSPAVPHDDPTLLFTNAGMNQFKDVFLGQGARLYTRAVDSQKCIRAGGKHNDLEDVGHDTYHHTFFEMLGNWSFGDYFKAEAIDWAWTLLTDVFGIDPARLYATWFEGDPAQGLEPDHEARDLWLKYLPADQVIPGNAKDNFWEMGETGPCGPCSEIHVDRIGGRNAAAMVNQDDPDVLEVWNLVFIQFNRESATVLNPLPAQHVDTGMGFERLVSVLQDRRSNYDTDLFAGIFDRIADVSGARPYRGHLEDPIDIAYRVIADHTRCLVAALSDGATPGADGRGYVLRRILRRAVRHGRQTLGMERPFLAGIVPAVVEILGDSFPEMKEKMPRVQEIIGQEEEMFRRTLDRGLQLFAEAAERSDDGRISSIDAFKLHDTYGFPIDLTQVMAEERDMTVDTEGYEVLMEEARSKSRAGGDVDDPVLTMPPDVLGKLDFLKVKPTDDDAKHLNHPTTGLIKAIWDGRHLCERSEHGQRVAVILDRTCFYGEQGGQVGDVGEIHVARGSSAGHDHVGKVDVEDARRVGDYVLHIGHVSHGAIAVGDECEVAVDVHRRSAIRAHHTATHLLNLALRAVAGPESEQRGSSVAADRLRFDYAASGPLDPDALEEIETRVNAAIAEKLDVHIGESPLDLAQKVNTVRAVFGERYPDPVRMVAVGPTVVDLLEAPDNPEWLERSVEFCGGTHLANTAEAADFVVLSEQGLAAGIRRVTALAGEPARAARLQATELETRLSAVETGDSSEPIDGVIRDFESATISVVDRHALGGRIESLRASAKSARKAAAAENRGAVVDAAREIAANAPGDAIVARIDGADKDALLSAMDAIRAVREDAAVLLLAADADQGKVVIVAKVPKTLIASGLKAGEWVKAAAQACGGGGGGRPDSAQAGGKDPARAEEAVEAARAHAKASGAS
ncbi:MAG: alanine--tRNA ligase [Phycisphaerales bacterium]|jgi:alanyl-tRNA synthetase|nr:alanine--tRNA ligase [Phycisphaerales bacterium]